MRRSGPAGARKQKVPSHAPPPDATMRKGRSHTFASRCSGAPARIVPSTLSLATLPIVRPRSNGNEAGLTAREVDRTSVLFVPPPRQAYRKFGSLDGPSPRIFGLHRLDGLHRPEAGVEPGRGSSLFSRSVGGDGGGHLRSRHRGTGSNRATGWLDPRRGVSPRR